MLGVNPCRARQPKKRMLLTSANSVSSELELASVWSLTGRRMMHQQLKGDPR